MLFIKLHLQYEQHRLAEDEQLQKNIPQYPDDLFYMKQTIHNACGTCALIHAISNNNEYMKFYRHCSSVSLMLILFPSFSIALEDGILKSYLDAARPLTAEERGKLLEGDTAFTDAHQTLAVEGPTESDANEFANHHFIALVQKNGELYELDGRKSFPIKHGSTTDESFLEVNFFCVVF